MTFEAAARLDPDEFAGDIEQGEWVPVSKNTWRHSEVTGNAYAKLREFARRHAELYRVLAAFWQQDPARW